MSENTAIAQSLDSVYKNYSGGGTNQSKLVASSGFGLQDCQCFIHLCVNKYHIDLKNTPSVLYCKRTCETEKFIFTNCSYTFYTVNFKHFFLYFQCKFSGFSSTLVVVNYTFKGIYKQFVCMFPTVVYGQDTTSTLLVEIQFICLCIAFMHDAMHELILNVNHVRTLPTRCS